MIDQLIFLSIHKSHLPDASLTPNGAPSGKLLLTLPPHIFQVNGSPPTLFLNSIMMNPSLDSNCIFPNSIEFTLLSPIYRLITRFLSSNSNHNGPIKRALGTVF